MRVVVSEGNKDKSFGYERVDLHAKGDLFLKVYRDQRGWPQKITYSQFPQGHLLSVDVYRDYYDNNLHARIINDTISVMWGTWPAVKDEPLSRSNFSTYKFHDFIGGNGSSFAKELTFQSEHNPGKEFIRLLDAIVRESERRRVELGKVIITQSLPDWMKSELGSCPVNLGVGVCELKSTLERIDKGCWEAFKDLMIA